MSGIARFSARNRSGLGWLGFGGDPREVVENRAEFLGFPGFAWVISRGRFFVFNHLMGSFGKIQFSGGVGVAGEVTVRRSVRRDV